MEKSNKKKYYYKNNSVKPKKKKNPNQQNNPIRVEQILPKEDKKVEKKNNFKSIKEFDTTYLPREEIVKEEKVIEEKIQEVKEEEVNTKEEKKQSTPRNSVYLSFNVRLIINALVLLALFVVLVYNVMSSFSTTSKEVIKYNVNSDIDYKVYLKDNKYYETPYLEKGMVYIASIIDKIDIDYKYNFNVDKNSDIDFTYKVKAKLVIASQANNAVFFEKEYDLTEEKKSEIINQNNYSISENVKLDYVYYNNLANGFRSDYAVNTNSYLEVYLDVNEKSKENNTYDLANSSKVVLTVPLSLQELNITLNNKNVNEQKELVVTHKTNGLSVPSVIIIILVLIAIVIMGYSLAKKILLVYNNDSKYDAYVKKILRGYDRIIVSVKTMPNFDDYNVIKVSGFQELVDVRDNLNVPINYFVVTEHQKCQFYVFGNNEVYLYVLKAVDLESDVKDEKKDISK